MARITHWILLLFASLQVAAQGNQLSVTVSHAVTGEPLEYLRLLLQAEDTIFIGCYTDSLGNCHFCCLPDGEYSMQIFQDNRPVKVADHVLLFGGRSMHLGITYPHPCLRADNKTQGQHCMANHRRSVVPIYNGYMLSPKIRRQIRHGRAVQGPCLRDVCSPDWHCKRCGVEF